MTEWREVPISDLCRRTTSGGTPSRARPEYFCDPPAGIPWVRSQELVDRTISRVGQHITPVGLHRSSAKIVPPDSVLIAMYGATVGQLGYLTIEAATNQAVCALITDPAATSPQFLFYLLMHARTDLITHAHGAAQQNLSQDRIRRFSLRVPPVLVQRRIADMLTAIDDLIENNRRRIELLEQMAQAIYREWFVHFRYPGHESATLADCPLGPIPEGWEVRQLTEVSSLVRGRSYRKHELVESGGVPFVNLKCMLRGGGFRRDGLKRYAGVYNADQRVSGGDIVLAVTDLTQGREILARATLVPKLAEDFGVISLDVARIVPNELDDRLALFFALRCTDFSDRVKEYANGSTVLHLSPTHVAAGQVVWPARALRRQFVRVVEAIVDQVDDLNDAGERLGAIRDLLLPKLVTGQIDVSNLDLDALVDSVA